MSLLTHCNCFTFRQIGSYPPTSNFGSNVSRALVGETMPRPNRDGTPAANPNKRTLTEKFLKRLKPQPRKFLIWDTKQRGLAVLAQPTGVKSWKCVYSRHGSPRWLRIGAVDAFGLDKDRKSAAKVMYEVSEGKDPAAERKADRASHRGGELVTIMNPQMDPAAQRQWETWAMRSFRRMTRSSASI